MYESSPRSREVANALFQIDRLSEDQTRAVLRHITIDDAVMNEAQCSHVASLIRGTLHKVSRERVNASLTCNTSLDAASHWERSFASHPGHVSATFRKDSISRENEADQAKEVVLFKPEESAPAPVKSESTDVKPSLGSNPDLKGLTIVNQGQMTLHYHSYNEASSLAPQTSGVPRKRALDRAEDEEYSEALASLLHFDLSPESRRNASPSPKRQRLEEPDIEMEEPEVRKPQNPVKKEEEEPVEKDTQNEDVTCKKCGASYKESENRASKRPCRFHSGKWAHYPDGLKRKGGKGWPKQTLYDAWSCCKSGAGAPGCRFGKHKKGRRWSTALSLGVTGQDLAG